MANSARTLLLLAALAALPAQAQALRGAGATFPAPLYKAWISAYGKENPGFELSYAEVGSGEGVKRFLAREVDFGASDTAMSDEEIRRAKDGAKLIPATAGLVVLAYNLPGAGGTLRLSREVYTDIFLGKITKWNDPRIEALNPGLRLRSRTIAIVARLDSSGTTFAFKIGEHLVIPGWEQGLTGMRAGGKRRLVIGSALGYGVSGSPPRIPPNATLVFDVTVVTVQ